MEEFKRYFCCFSPSGVSGRGCGRCWLHCPADPAAHPAGSGSLLEGKGGDPACLLLCTRMFVERGRGGCQRGGLPALSRCQLSLPAWGWMLGLAGWSSVAPCLQSLAWGEVSPPGRGSTDEPLGDCLPQVLSWPWASPPEGQAGARLFVRCCCIAAGRGDPAAPAKVNVGN